MEWKQIENYSDYVVSDTGIVKRIHYEDIANSKKFCGEKILKPQKDKDGYLRYALSKDGVIKHFFAHRLVATAFLDNSNDLPQVNHINGNKSDNRVENLEWCTASQNIQHRIKVLGTTLRNKKGSKPVTQYDLNGKVVAWYPSAKEAARQTGLNQSHISECCRHEIEKYKSYVWRYELCGGND